jgi:hypothetical protein
MGRCPTGTVPGSVQRGGRKRGLQTDLQNEIVREIETLLGCQSIADLDFEAVEMAALRQFLRLAALALEQRLNTGTSDHVGPQLPCPCGGSAQYHGRHGKAFESVLGPLHLHGAYYHCEQCESGFCPRDRALGLESFSPTPGVLSMAASAAALLSFEESSGLLHELAGGEVSAKQVERAAEAVGAEIAVDEHQQVETSSRDSAVQPWFHRSSASGGVGRWHSLDLELGYGTIPASHSGSRPAWWRPDVMQGALLRGVCLR